MRRKHIYYLFSAGLLIPLNAKSDLFGTDTAVLAQILGENIKQLVELEQVVRSGQESLQLVQDINQGINDSLAQIKTMGPNLKPGIFENLKTVDEVLRKFNTIYGEVAKSPDSLSQESVDHAVAEAVSMNNSLYDYAHDVDRIGEQIKNYSHDVSPGGAAKLTAQSLGVMIHVLSEQLRAQGTAMKLQAQSIAQANKKEKTATAEYLKSAETIATALKASDPKFERPRF